MRKFTFQRIAEKINLIGFSEKKSLSNVAKENRRYTKNRDLLLTFSIPTSVIWETPSRQQQYNYSLHFFYSYFS